MAKKYTSMKTLTFAALVSAFIPSAVLGQGTVSFGSSTLDQYFQYPNGVKATGLTVELWWSPDNFWPYQKIATTTTGTGALAGYVAPSVLVTTGPATPPGASAWFYVYAWIISDHHWSGATPRFMNPTGAPNAIPPTPPATRDGWTSPITIVWIPEPSIIGLAGLGLAGLLFFRRRK